MYNLCGTFFPGFNELIRLLVYSGFNAHQKDNYGQTALHLACINGNLTSVQELCEQVRIVTPFSPRIASSAWKQCYLSYESNPSGWCRSWWNGQKWENSAHVSYWPQARKSHKLLEKTIRREKQCPAQNRHLVSLHLSFSSGWCGNWPKGHKWENSTHVGSWPQAWKSCKPFRNPIKKKKECLKTRHLVSLFAQNHHPCLSVKVIELRQASLW